MLIVLEKGSFGSGQPFDIEVFAERAPAADFRRGTWTLFSKTGEEDMALNLDEFKQSMQCESRGMSYLAARTATETVILIHKNKGMRLQYGSWEIYKLKNQCNNPMPPAIALEVCKERIYTIKVQKDESKALSAAEVIKPYVGWSPMNFQAHLVDLEEQKSEGTS